MTPDDVIDMTEWLSWLDREVEKLPVAEYNRLGHRVAEIGMDDSYGPGDAARQIVIECLEAVGARDVEEGLEEEEDV